MKEKKKGNIIGILIVMAIIIFGVIYGGITLTKNWGKSKETISFIASLFNYCFFLFTIFNT